MTDYQQRVRAYRNLLRRAIDVELERIFPENQCAPELSTAMTRLTSTSDNTLLRAIGEILANCERRRLSRQEGV